MPSISRLLRRPWAAPLAPLALALSLAFPGLAYAAEPVPPECRLVPFPPGPEDLQLDPDTQKAYVSSDDRRATLAGTPKRGEIFAFDPANPEAAPVPLTKGLPAEFHPHGISLYRGPDGAKRLFVINHHTDGTHAIEIYDVAPDGLAHAETVRYEALTSPNDLVAVGPRQFYATNDKRAKGMGFRWYVEMIFRLPHASISYFDGLAGRIEATGLKYANGVNVSADGRTLYAAEVNRKTLARYARDPDSGRLTLQDRIELDAGPDNIDIDEAGLLWVAAHPKPLAFVGHARDAGNPSPSLIYRVDPATKQAQAVYSDDGKTISAVATAAVGGPFMVLGGVFDPKLLVCRRP